ncbi:hypothetical protein BC831DRAFT_479726 [Entophlyctis helioformis]|nr:hypothetical protein BC831DRAFT_479726 [Entophlyctis helioformis]
MTSRRKQAAGVDEGETDAIIKSWNTTRGSALIHMALYFASAKTAADVCMSDLDTAGFTLQYVEKNVDHGLQQVETRVQFDRPVGSLAAIEQKLEGMAYEARTALSMKPNKNYVAPGTRKDELFVPPTLATSIGLTIFWTVLYCISCVDALPAPLEILRSIIGGRAACENMALGIVCIHVLECAAVFGFGLWSEIPLDIVAKWVGLTSYYGFATLGPFIKIAYKHRMKLDAAEDIQN